MRSSKEYKGIALSNLKNNWGKAIIVSLLVVAISSFSSLIMIVGSIVSIFLSGQLMVGEMNFYTKLHNKQNPEINTLFHNFGENVISNFITYLIQSLYMALWMLLFIVPGIIKSFSYSMTMYLKSKKPELTANEAITMSRKLMDGNKWKLACLEFSFIGWILLSILTLGIGIVFVIPYMQSTTVAFYEDIYNKAFNNVTNEEISNDENIIIE